MITQVEQGITDWLLGQFGALAQESDLFPAIALATSTKSTEKDAVQLRLVTKQLVPEVEDQVVGTAPIEAGLTGRWQGNLEITLEGEAAATDLAGLTLLALLREWSGPAPDLPSRGIGQEAGAEPASALSPSGRRQATAGTRRIDLSWTAPEPGPAIVTTLRGKRRWAIPLAVKLQFRVSPAPLEGGRILQVQTDQTAQGVVNQRQEATLYAAAEAIPLAYFGGLDQPLLAALHREGIEVLGDLAQLGEERATLLAARLQIKPSLLTDLATVAAARQRWADAFASPVLPEALKHLSARALVAPSTEERTQIEELASLPSTASWLALAAVPVAAALLDERREQIPLGSLLLVQRR